MLADATKLLKRLEQLRSGRSVVEEEWRQGYRYTYPLRGVGFETLGASASGQTNAAIAAQNQADLLHTVGTDSARILSAALMSGTTPGNSRWLGLDAGDESDEERIWLDQSADTLWQLIHASNYDAVGIDCFDDMVVAGMFPLFVDEDPEGGLRMEQWALANTFFAASKPGGAIDTGFNEFPLSAEQAIADYGPEMVSEKVRACVSAGKPDEQVQFVRCIYPRQGASGMLTKNLPFASVHIEKDSKKIVRESGYHENPLGVPRWKKIPGSVYAFGPTKEALPDLKTLNEAIKFDLANMDLALAGMWGAVDDGVMNPRSIRVGPRKVIVMAAKENFFPLTPGGDFKAALIQIERLERNIRKVMMADQLEPQLKAGTPPTATEMMIRVELIRQLLGPVYGRMMSEFLQWFVRRCFGLAYRAGAFKPVPQSLLGRLLTVQYLSPIARAQKGADVAAMDRYEAALGAQAQAGLTDAVDLYEWDEARRHRADLLGVPAKLIPDEDTVAERRKMKTRAARNEQSRELVAEVIRDRKGDISGFAKPAKAA